MGEDRNNRQLEGYEKMLERVTHLLQDASGQASPRFREALRRARERAVELGELTSDEAERIGEYIRRDVEDAARYLSREDTDDDLAGWFRMDLQLIENWLLDRFFSVADRTKFELQEFNRSLASSATWHTGEITGPGELRCTQCGQTLQFGKTGQVPPCPSCKNTEYHRVTTAD